MYVNPARRSARKSGRVVIRRGAGGKFAPAKRRARRAKPGEAKRFRAWKSEMSGWAKKRRARKSKLNPAWRRTAGGARIRPKAKRRSTTRRKSMPKRRATSRLRKSAKARRARARKAAKARWGKRKTSQLRVSAQGRRRRARKAAKARWGKKTRRRSRRKSTAKRRRSRRSSPKRSRKSRRRSRRKSSRRSRRTRRTRMTKSMRKARRRHRKQLPAHQRATVVINPGRRRRRSRRRSRGGYRRRRRGSLARRYSRRRRNPGFSGTGGMLFSLVKRAIPVLASVLGTRFLINKVGPMIPLVDRLGAFQRPVLSLAAAVGANYATGKVRFLARYKTEIMVGQGLNVLESLISAFAPDSVKAMIGLGDDGLYGRALSDYVQVGDYLTTGGTPIDDDIALSDYVTVGEIEEELGAMGDGLQEELGLEEELGQDGGLVGPGVSQSSLMAPVPHRSFVAPIPNRTFTKAVGHAGVGYDNPGALYAGIFSGGF